MKKKISLLLCALFVLLCVGACGNKGDLYMPQEPVNKQDAKKPQEAQKEKNTEAIAPQPKKISKEDGVS